MPLMYDENRELFFIPKEDLEDQDGTDEMDDDADEYFFNAMNKDD